jgi:hypothetical protein
MPFIVSQGTDGCPGSFYERSLNLPTGIRSKVECLEAFKNAIYLPEEI